MKRNYNLELLRILAMIMIVTLHYMTFGIEIRQSSSLAYHNNYYWFIYALCHGAVNLFVLLTGYFQIKSTFKWKKVYKLWLQVFFYSLLFGILLSILGYYKLHIIDILHILFPIVSKSWWFISTYMILYILSPFFNKFLLNLNQKEYKYLILIIVICVILNNIIPGSYFIDNYHGYNILWFLCIYTVGAYIRLYDIKKVNTYLYLIVYLICSLITVLSRFILLNYLHKYINYFDGGNYLYAYNSLTIFIGSVALFMFFKNIKIKPIFYKLVTTLSSTTFGVYLIHEHFMIRPLLWNDIIKIDMYYNDHKYLFLVTSVLSIFIICSFIEYLRMLVFKKLKV